MSKYINVIKPIEMEITDTTKLVISANKKGEEGDIFIDIRTYINTSSYKGPTKKGISFHIERLEEFKESILKLDSTLEEKGY